MREVNTIDINYIPKIHAYSTNFWKSTTGTPTYDSGTASLFVNAAEMTSLFTVNTKNGGAIRMEVKVPTAPATGDVRKFGFRNPGTTEGIFFDITDAVFGAFVAYPSGESEFSPITWIAGWTDTNTVFEIVLNGNKAQFYIGGTLLKTIDIEQNMFPLPVSFENQETNNMAVKQVTLLGVEAFNPISP